MEMLILYINFVLLNVKIMNINIDLKNKNVIFPIGISGSGKTHFWKNYFDIIFKLSTNIDKDCFYISSDKIRNDYLHDINNHKHEVFVWNKVRELYSEYLNKYNIVYIDNLNIRPTHFKEFLVKDGKNIGLIFKPNIDLSEKRISTQLSNNENRSNINREILMKQLNFFNSNISKVSDYKNDWNNMNKEKIKKRLSLYYFQEIYFIDEFIL